MARVNTLLFLVTVALVVVAAIDCLATEPSRVRHFPRGAWLLLVLCCPVAGAIAWFRAGRVTNAPVAAVPLRTAPLGPEDDPEFIRMLAEVLRNR
ncbi:drug/metabolite transporter (DMT)-like permease [Actinoplanes octamycinicus]|uniref:Drug/metabolite transporter (DMT)-like permease n=1 Tax=Actinoplanes octamycinicus TaxID=135948 RepID=A0A7W7MDH3_9ACTN|nr:PLDc N-terminal domain-containing protein [Actinoplanes octamycinicus]MBB4745755.1 drug/metabolite transporter (DMT)-like permease [Actinoplanes octamycinicus]GIE56602.1 membrane protein [Actinoplanes octamycinicus]